jgi:hypothetical protein
MLLSIVLAFGFNEKLSLATVAGVGAKNGKVDHGLKQVVEALASELPNNTGKGQER